MGRKPKRKPSFFKVLIEDFTKKLRIPPLFVKNFKEKLPENPILKTESEEKSWTAKIKKSGEKYWFTNGWHKFVRDHELQTGDFLVFRLIIDSTFKVEIYGKSGCEKEVELASIENPYTHVNGFKNHPMKIESESEDVFEVDAPVKPMNPSFVIVWKKYMKYHMTIPTRFAKETGIASKRSIVVRNQEGKEWIISICMRTSTYCRIDMGSGWFEFRKANNLVHGNLCLFKFIPGDGDVLQFQVLKKG